MNTEDVSQKRRSYSSRLREEQAEQTRERILAAVGGLLRAGDLEELSFASVAREAGVSVPTVYRYFPSRDALFEGVQEWLTRELKAPPFPKDWSELAERAPQIAAYYEDARDLFRTAMVTSLFREVGETSRRRRDRAMAHLLEPLTGHLEERRANAIHALMRLMFGFEGYSFISERFGVTPQEAGEAIAWVTETLTGRLRRDAMKSNGAESNGGTTKRRAKRSAAKD